VSLVGSSLVAIAVLLAQVSIDTRQAERFKTLDDRRQQQADRQQLQLSLGFQDDLSGIDLHGRDLSGFYLPGKDLSDANLERALLVGAFMERSRFIGAHMPRANLSRARVGGTYEAPRDALDHGSFSGTASFAGADLRGADLSRVDGLEDSFDATWDSSPDDPARLALAYYSKSTRFPAAFDPEPALMVSVSDDQQLPDE
jgi:uncharacterized protein YjbI with pentapeptide repeats